MLAVADRAIGFRRRNHDDARKIRRFGASSVRIIAPYNGAHASIRRPAADTMMTIITSYKGSPDFTNLAPSSRRMYLRYIGLIEETFGDLPLAALEDRRVRGEFKDWRDTFAATPRKADYAWRLMSFAKDRGTIATNPCGRPSLRRGPN